jgi:hypothetical protein
VTASTIFLHTNAAAKPDRRCATRVSSYRNPCGSVFLWPKTGSRAPLSSTTISSAMPSWFAGHRGEIKAQPLGPQARAASLTILAEYEHVPGCIEGLGALNRWPGRSGIPLTDYLQHWEVNCTEQDASTHLPVRLRELLRA